MNRCYNIDRLLSDNDLKFCSLLFIHKDLTKFSGLTSYIIIYTIEITAITAPSRSHAEPTWKSALIGRKSRMGDHDSARANQIVRQRILLQDSWPLNVFKSIYDPGLILLHRQSEISAFGINPINTVLELVT